MKIAILADDDIIVIHPDDASKYEGWKIIDGKNLAKYITLGDIPDFSDISGREETVISDEELIPFYRQKTVFVTGGEGFIGSNIVQNLLSLPVAKVIVYGHGEHGLYNLSKKHDRRFEFVLGDIRDTKKLESSMKKYSPAWSFMRRLTNMCLYLTPTPKKPSRPIY